VSVKTPRLMRRFHRKFKYQSVKRTSRSNSKTLSVSVITNRYNYLTLANDEKKSPLLTENFEFVDENNFVKEMQRNFTINNFYSL
jgi:nitrate reductase beta subunit